MKSTFVIALFCILSVSCASTNQPSQSFKVSSYEKAWDCAISTASRMGVRIISSAKESGTIFGQKVLDDINIAILKKPGGVDVVVNRFGNLSFIPTTGSFPTDFYLQYEGCVK